MAYKQITCPKSCAANSGSCIVKIFCATHGQGTTHRIAFNFKIDNFTASVFRGNGAVKCG